MRKEKKIKEKKMVRCTEGKVTYNRLWQLRAPR